MSKADKSNVDYANPRVTYDWLFTNDWGQHLHTEKQ